jgi:DNA-binding NarL/FixJ family response regulator
LPIDGVILTGSLGGEMVAALHRIAAGSSVFPAGWLSTAHQVRASALDTLSARQLEVLELLAQGLPNETIAERLFISRNTVKFHVATIYQRLGVRNRVQAAHALSSLRLSA